MILTSVLVMNILLSGEKQWKKCYQKNNETY